MKKVIEPYDILIRHTLNVELNLYESYETHFTRENLEIKKNYSGGYCIYRWGNLTFA